MTVTDLPKADYWIRMPQEKGRCTHTGLSRSSLYYLITQSKGQIKSVVIKRPGALRGIRLVHLATLQSYLSRLAETQAGAGEQFREAKIQTSNLKEEQEVAACEK
jgi:hypothetical protein